MQPQFVSHLSRDGRLVKRCEPVVLKERICSAPVLKDVRDMLRGVVDSGTAIDLRAAHSPSPGKTGTASIARTRPGYKSEG